MSTNNVSPGLLKSNGKKERDPILISDAEEVSAIAENERGHVRMKVDLGNSGGRVHLKQKIIKENVFKNIFITQIVKSIRGGLQSVLLCRRRQ
jgi:hypothetical protein